jgi:NadR type nicotinamide-nucleotide adenylyltransferase
VDAVFSSEPYGDELARRFGAVHVCVDHQRVARPVSGTACRADLAGLWHELAPATRRGLTTRIVVVGAESTGTTTVSRALAAHYRARGGVWEQTGWVPEYGRDYTIQKWDAARQQARMAGLPEPTMNDLVWTAQDFADIAVTQTRLEQQAAGVGAPLLLCDTDAWATSVWEYRYLGARSRGADQAATVDLPPRDIYLLTDHEGVPFVQDGLRDGERIRADMTEWFVDRLARAGHSWCLLTGTLEDRLRLAVRVTDQLLAQRASFAEPIG